jgi:Flp pilus assembly pilin Flp
MPPILFTLESLVRRRLRPGRGAEAGQTSAEYALVLLGAALVAMLVVAWARSTGKVGDLLDGILDDIIDTAS